MLLTLTTTHRPATDLGFLLHKHPDKHQAFDLPFAPSDGLGPVYNDTSCVACHNLGAPGGAGPDNKSVDILTAVAVKDDDHRVSSVIGLALLSRPKIELLVAALGRDLATSSNACERSTEKYARPVASRICARVVLAASSCAWAWSLAISTRLAVRPKSVTIWLTVSPVPRRL